MKIPTTLINTFNLHIEVRYSIIVGMGTIVSNLSVPLLSLLHFGGTAEFWMYSYL
jgi:hypothetical protein